MQNGFPPNGNAGEMVMNTKVPMTGPLLALVGLVLFVTAIVFVSRWILKKKYPDKA